MMQLAGQVSDYIKMYNEGMAAINQAALKQVINIVKYSSLNDLSVYVGGNGGSAAISNHLCCDFIKGTACKTISLSCNTPLITAIGNDYGYEKTMSYQLENYIRKDEDCTVILVSSSGNSPNIIHAANLVNKLGVKLIGLTGFDGGKLKDLCNVSLHIPIYNYGVVEDCHQSIMHIISQIINKERDQ